MPVLSPDAASAGSCLSRRHVLGLAALSGLAALGGCATAGEPSPPPPGVAVVVSATTLLAFSPAVVQIKAGDTVEWRNASPFGHTVTADPALVKNPANVRLPKGARPFNGPLPAGGTYRHKFNRPGTYDYVCLPHEGAGMKGRVVVTAG